MGINYQTAESVTEVFYEETHKAQGGFIGSCMCWMLNCCRGTFSPDAGKKNEEEF